MSVFRTASIDCPACGGAVEFDLVHSVNADRRPDLRGQILDASFQRRACTGCGHESRVQPELNYLDIGRRQWIAAWPQDALATWQEHTARAQSAFDEAFGAAAPAGAREIGKALRCRVTFGWAALREKALLAGTRLDDVAVELAKLALIRSSRMPPLGTAELRLVALQGEELLFAWLDRRSGEPLELLRVPLTLLDEIAAEPEWAPLREQLSASPFVDAQRLYVAGTPRVLAASV